MVLDLVLGSRNSYTYSTGTWYCRSTQVDSATHAATHAATVCTHSAFFTDHTGTGSSDTVNEFPTPTVGETLKLN